MTFDQPRLLLASQEFAKGADKAMNNEEIVLDVMGMSCPSCVGHVNESLSDLEGVAKVEVRFRDGKVVVQYDPKLIAVSTLIGALGEAGYESTISVAA